MIYNSIVSSRNMARKNGDNSLVAYSVILGEIQRAVTPTIINGDKRYNDAEVISVLKKLVNTWFDNPEQNKIEIEVANSFLPKQMTRDELVLIKRAMNAPNIGEFMKYLKTEFPGLYDGKLAKEVWDETE